MMELPYKEAVKFIRYVCAQLGIPPPRTAKLDPASFNDGVFIGSRLEIQIKEPTDYEVLFHEVCHYIFFLIKHMDTDDDIDNLEHRFLALLEKHNVGEAIGKEYEKTYKRAGQNTDI